MRPLLLLIVALLTLPAVADDHAALYTHKCAPTDADLRGNADNGSKLHLEHCAACHGVDLRGTKAAPSLVGRALTFGEGHGELMRAISGHPDMPPSHDWRKELPEKLIKGIALFVSERRQGYVSTAASYKFAPEGTQNQQSEHHAFAVERVVTLNSRPYSVAALPDGRLLVAEKTRGLSVNDKGRQEPPVTGTPLSLIHI